MAKERTTTQVTQVSYMEAKENLALRLEILNVGLRKQNVA